MPTEGVVAAAATVERTSANSAAAATQKWTPPARRSSIIAQTIRRKKKRERMDLPPSFPIRSYTTQEILSDYRPVQHGRPYSLQQYPQLALDDTQDYSSLATAFKRPLFNRNPSPALSIAYSHRNAAQSERHLIRTKKNSVIMELEQLQADFHAKKQELKNVNETLKLNSNKLGAWNRKVFDLELQEPCSWNDKLAKLQQYVAIHGVPPAHSNKKRRRLTEEANARKGSNLTAADEKSLATFVSGMKQKVKKKDKAIANYPHRKEALQELGIVWDKHGNDARFDVMFDRLMDYRKEMGTFRMPSLDMCKESGDESLVELHNWVFSQVGSFRYQLPSKKVETVKKFLDVGFSFEKWYGTNGHVFDKDILPFDEIAKKFVESGGEIPEEYGVMLESSGGDGLDGKKKKKRKYGIPNERRKKKAKMDDDDNDTKELKEYGGDGEAAAASTDLAAAARGGKSNTEGIAQQPDHSETHDV